MVGATTVGATSLVTSVEGLGLGGVLFFFFLLPLGVLGFFDGVRIRPITAKGFFAMSMGRRKRLGVRVRVVWKEGGGGGCEVSFLCEKNPIK